MVIVGGSLSGSLKAALHIIVEVIGIPFYADEKKPLPAKASSGQKDGAGHAFHHRGVSQSGEALTDGPGFAKLIKRY